jgi:hypothetical protein
MNLPLTVSETLAEDIARDGYAFVPGVLRPAQVAALCTAIEACRAAPGPTFRVLSGPGEPHLESELFRWPDQPAIRAAVSEGALPRLAAAAFGTDRVILMEDQWFLSEAGAGARSPWHQDHTYHPLEPWFLTIWVALDDPPGPVGLMVAAGSHDGQMYGPVEFSAGDATLGSGTPALRPVPDIDADPRRWRVTIPPARAGDAILMDSRTLHAAGGYCTARFRRISVRYAHPDTRIVPRDWPVATFWNDHAFASVAGSRIDGATFPMILP